MTNTDIVKEVAFINNGEEAVVRATSKGVEIERGGTVTPFQPHYTFEQIIGHMKAAGWVEKPKEITPEKLFGAISVSTTDPINPAENTNNLGNTTAHLNGIDKVAEQAFSQGVPVALQKKVDEYIEIHRRKAELDKELKALRRDIEPYMKNNGIKLIKSTLGPSIAIQDALASNSTSRYTDFELEDVMKNLDSSLLKQVTEIRVNAEKLDGVLKTSKLPKETVERIRSLKVAIPGTPRFTVKK